MASGPRAGLIRALAIEFAKQSFVSRVTKQELRHQMQFAAYRTLPDLQEYVLIDPDRRSLEVFRRTATDDWLFATRDSARALVLVSLDFEAGFDAVFEDLEA